PTDSGQTMTNQDQYTTNSIGNKGVTSGITGNSYDLKQPQNNPVYSGDIPAETKQKIVNKVRSISNPSLHHVYVSAHPALARIFENYRRDVRQGKPLSGAIVEFNILAQRIFPT